MRYNATPSEAQPGLKKDPLAFDVRTAADEKLADFGRVIVAVVERVESKKNLAAGREVSLQVVQEKIPFRRSPAFLRRMVKIEIDRECRDPIERLTEIRQRLVCIDSANDSLNSEQLQQFAEQRNALDIEAQHGMTQILQDEQKESAAATQVEDAFGRRAMKIQILHPFTIQSQPRLDVRVFGVARRGIRIPLLDFTSAFLIDLRQHRLKWDAKNGALRPAPAASVRERLGEFEYFPRYFHS